MRASLIFLWAAVASAMSCGGVGAQVVINEIMYHPVEKPAFDASGDPVLDLSNDVHEFIELWNAGPAPVDLAGWRLAGGITYVFPVGTLVSAGGYVVVARHPRRLEAVAAYGLGAGTVLGPWQGGLSNQGEALRLENVAGAVMDGLSYASAAPWPLGANSFGAEDEWTGLDEYAHQYRGRSLERITAAWPANDPANWLASPIDSGPSPGRPNAVVRAAPLPVVMTVAAAQASTGSELVRADEPVQVDATFSSAGAGVSAVAVEYFKDDINSTSELTTVIAMTAVTGEPGRWRALLPGQTNRSLVRYRIHADRGDGTSVVSPRPGDPLAWHAYFVSPVRSGARPHYDILVASASLARLSANISSSPRRVMTPDPPGLPRAAWNATEPAVLVRDGRVIDVRLRHHGSRYNRSTLRASFKVKFPRYARLDGAEALFFKDKGEEHRIGTLLYREAGLPSFDSRMVDLSLNNNAVIQRLEVPELDERHFEKFARAQATRYPGTVFEPTGEFYKSTGVVPFETAAGLGATAVYNQSGEGPYFIGNAAPIPAKTGWSARQRYDYTYGGQMHRWIGGRDTESMIAGLWAARGDSPTAPNPNLPALRAWLATHFDVDATLRYIALRNWCAPFDNATHNYYLWRRANGRWAMLPWDLDGELTNSTKSIYWDEYESPQPDTLRGPHWIKDSFFKAFRDEYRLTLWLLNHTVLLPSRFGPSGYNGYQSFATARHTSVNAQLGFGPFHRPDRPVATAPVPGATVLPGASLQTAGYSHSAPAPTPSHATTTWVIRAADAAWDAPAVHRTSSTALTTLPIPFGQLTFGTTYVWKCLHTDADGHPSFESEERSFVFGLADGPAPVVRLNEVFARGSGPDFIEIHNAGATAADLGGMGLTDNPAVPAKQHFPAGATIEPGAYLVVVLDAAAAFRLNGDGQTVILLRPDGTMADAVDFGPQAVDRSIGRGPTGWSIGLPTPGADNVVLPTGPATGVRINEWLASNPGGPDWFELVNIGSEPVHLGGMKLGNGTSETILPALTFMAAGGFQKIVADREPGPNHVDFRLSASGETIILSDAAGTVLDTVSFGPQTSAISEGRLPDGTGAIVRFPGHATPGAPNAFGIDDIVISRVFPDLELYNRSANPVVIDGWGVGPALRSLGAYAVPPGTGAIAPGATRVISSAALPFPLDRLRGGELILSHSGTHRSHRHYGAWDGHPWGVIFREAGDVFVRVQELPATPGNVPVVGPIVISEINYHPPDMPGDDSNYEFVEWLNTGPVAVDVGDWQLDGDARFNLPSGTVLEPEGRLVIAAVSPAEHAARYDLPAGAMVFGPWSGGLPNSGGIVRVVRRLPAVDDPGPDFGYRPSVVVEEVVYDDVVPWPTDPDGRGPALVRSAPAGFGGDAAHWSAAAPSPGAPPTPNLPPTVAIVSPAHGASFAAGLAIPIEAAAADPEGALKLVVLEVDGTTVAQATQPPYRFVWTGPQPGNYTLRVRAIDGRLATAAATLALTLTNDPPMAALLQPASGTRIIAGSSTLLRAAAVDPEGLLDRVEFLVDGAPIDTATAPPWQVEWTAGPPGYRTLHARAVDATGLAQLSQPVQVAIAGDSPASPVIAYQVPVGTTGNQSFAGSLGHDFVVVSPIVITRLGVFDSGGNGLTSTLTSQIWQHQSPPQRLATLSFSPANPREIAPATTSRFKPLPSPLILAPGTYSSVVYGYSATEPNGNASGSPGAWTADSGHGLIEFVGTARYGSPGQFPTNVDGGPADRYAGPTFEFITADGDGDFMPVDWELAHGFDPDDPVDGLLDSDGDGATNQEEYAAGTDPRDPHSRLAVEMVHAAGDLITVRMVLPPHRTAVLQSSRELIFWTDRDSMPPAAAARTIEFTTPVAEPEYLRVLVRP